MDQGTEANDFNIILVSFLTQFTFFLKKCLFLCAYMFHLYPCVPVHHMIPVPMEARSRRYIPWELTMTTNLPPKTLVECSITS